MLSRLRAGKVVLRLIYFVSIYSDSIHLLLGLLFIRSNCNVLVILDSAFSVTLFPVAGFINSSLASWRSHTVAEKENGSTALFIIDKLKFELGGG